MAKIVLTIQADNKATQSVKLLNAEVQTLSKTLSTIKVNKNLTAQINALTKHYTALAKAAVRVNEATTKRQIAEQKLANEVKRGRTEDQRTLQAKARREQAELRLKQAQDKATQSTQKQTTATKQNTEANKEHRQSILSMTRGILEWQIATTLVMKPLRMLQDALTSINETLVNTEDRVIELQRVVGSVANANELYDLVAKYGQTFENVSEATLNFARRGMTWNESLKATEAALLAINVAELDVGQATDGLGAIMAQFGIQASELTNVVDLLNKTADKFPVTTEKILAALQRTGSTASTANLSLEETIGLITTLSKATNRSGENIGTALNSILNIAQKETTLETFSKLGGNVAQIVEQYRGGGTSILEVLRAVSKEIENLNTQQIFDSEAFNDLNEDLKESMGEDFEMLSEIYGTAGTYRRNYFIALLNDLDTVKQVEKEISDAQGYSQDENQKYLDTYTAKLNSLQAKWQDIANDEQGLLGIKKDLLDMGNGVLNIIQAVGGLKTALIALGVVVGTIVLSFKGEAIIATLTKIGTLLKSLTIDAIPNAIGAWKSFAKGISSASTALQASLPLITALVVAISAIDSAIRRSIEAREEAKRKAIEQQNEAIAKANESIDSQKKQVAQINEVADSVENLRKILDDSSQSEEEKAKAQDKLLQIQNTLVERNNKYKDSLDLTNGSLKEQLGLIEQLTTEQLKQKAKDFLQTNESEIEIAKSRLDSTSTTSTDYFLTGVGNDRHRFRDVINKAILGANIDNIAKLVEDNEYGFFHRYGNNVVNGWNEDGIIGAVKGLFSAPGTVFEGESWVGEANAGVGFSGTIEQQIDAITKLKDYIATNKDTLGLSSEEVVAITTELGNQLTTLNSEEYKQAQLLAERAKATQDWIDGTITEAEYLKIVYGIVKDTNKETENWTNNIQDAKDYYDDLISKLEELRDLQKESTEWEEKKLAVLEAEQALENAKNEATVRRFNEATGQWEWQTDEKKIAEAEKNLTSAKENLSDATYDEIIKMLEEKTATNDKIDEIVNDAAKYLGDEFAKTIQATFRELTGVDFTLPPNPPPPESHDNGGLALGKGFINKATDRPESVNNPELTKKILSPVSNAEFNRYVRDMGIMFERSHEYAQVAPIIERVGGNTDNRVDNSGQINFAGGLTVGSEQRSNLLDILRTASIVPND